MPAERRHRLQHQPSDPYAGLRFRWLRQFWHAYQWQIILSLLLVSLTLGYIGFWKYSRAIDAPHSPTDLLYKTIQLTTLESGAVSGPVSWELEVARLLVPVLTASTALLAAAVLFRKQLQMIRLWYLREHIVVCGLGDKSTLLATSLRQRGYDVVAIELDVNNPSIDLCREIGIIVLEGDATDPALLRKTAVHRASHLVSMCGDDGVNAEVAMLTRQLTANRKHGALHCSIHIVNPDLCELLREQEFGTKAFPNFRLEMFNIYELGARALLRDYPPFDGRSSANPVGPHILVVGPGRLGENLVIQSARTWYDQTRGNGAPLRITLVGLDAGVLATWLNKHYPKISCCCELIPYPLDLTAYDFSEAGFLFNPQGICDIDRIYVCPGDQTLGLPSALKLRQRLECDQPQIVVRMDENSGLAKLLTGKVTEAGNSRNIVPFGLSQHINMANLVLGGTCEILAQAIHEDYLQRRLAEGLKLGDKRSLVHWDQLPEDLRESNRRQIDHTRLKLQIAGYAIQPLVDWEAASYQFEPQEVESMAKMEHDHWVQERQRSGWRYAPGPENTPKKTHADLVPWEDLPEAARDKDRQPGINLPRVLAQAGFQVYRLNGK